MGPVKMSIRMSALLEGVETVPSCVALVHALIV